METLRKYPLAVKAIVTILAPAILYWQDLTIVFNEALKSDLATHILAIPFLIAYIFRAGTEPPCSSAADVNTDCSVDVGDAVFLINHIFRGAASPQCSACA